MPQWNCACTNCLSARRGIIPFRTQSSVAISDDLDRWYLVNASPDVSFQIGQFPKLHPRPKPDRNSPIAGVFLTNSDLDHVLGLFSLREGGCLDVYATSGVRRTLEKSLGVEKVLESFCGLHWHEVATGELVPLTRNSDQKQTLLYRCIELPGKPPPFVRESDFDSAGVQSVACQFFNPRTKQSLLVAPDVATITPDLMSALKASNLILFDGTFWSSDELGKIRPDARNADEMGHVTIKDCSLGVLSKLPALQKVYIHINNTNPILAADSPERAAVEDAGMIVGCDGMEFEL